MLDERDSARKEEVKVTRALARRQPPGPDHQANSSSVAPKQKATCKNKAKGKAKSKHSAHGAKDGISDLSKEEYKRVHSRAWHRARNEVKGTMSDEEVKRHASIAARAAVDKWRKVCRH